MNEKPDHSSSIGWVVIGFLLTLLTWLFAAFIMYGTMAGDCMPELGHDCPTDEERNLRVILILVAAIAVNVGALFLVGRARRR